jgi:hypothetical protein
MSVCFAKAILLLCLDVQRQIGKVQHTVVGTDSSNFKSPLTLHLCLWFNLQAYTLNISSEVVISTWAMNLST